MTEKQVHHTSKLALRAANKFRDAAINADAAYQTYFRDASPRYAATRLRTFAELMPGLAADLLVTSGDFLNRDVPK